MTLWRWLIAFLTWLSADPAAVEKEAPQAAAAVAAARASMVTASPLPTPGPTPQECVCGRTCVNGVWRPDGHISQPCPCKCERCVKKPGCSACRVPGASPASGSPATP